VTLTRISAPLVYYI